MLMYPITPDDVELLRACLRLDAASGTLFWKQKISKKVIVGAEAGSVRRDGYRLIQIQKRRFLAHRVVYAMLNGDCVGEVDHINGNPLDNRPENLRLATRSQQNINRGVQSNNTSGHKGVYRHQNKYWAARIKVRDKYICLGYYNDINLAAEAYRSAAEVYHGQYRRAY